MASADVVAQIITMTRDFLAYMLPVIATLAGIGFIISWLMYITVGMGRRVFK